VAEVRSVPAPAEFDRAVRSLHRAVLRAEVRLQEIRAPQRLAPWAHALALEVTQGGEPVASGRLVLLHDPQGQPSWQGTFRLVGYASVDLDAELAHDPLLPEVGWSWLVDALDGNGARHTAAGGTVTQTSSTRFGEVAPADTAEPDPDDPASSSELEVRASWTPLDPDLSAHLRAWADLLCTAAGLPPPGIAVLPGRPDPTG
jgi:hypothetical protein